MSHVRQQIREECVTLLKQVPGMSNRVLASRPYAVQKSPFILVYTQEEDGETDILGTPGTSMRTLTLNVEIYSSAGSSKFDAEIDGLAAQIEAILSPAPGRFVMCKDYQYTGMGIDYSADGERAAGVARLSYSFIYRVDTDDPQQGV